MADEHAPLTGGDGSAAEPGLAALARHWAAVAIDVSHLLAPRAESEATLADIAGGLIALIRADPFDPTPAAEAGRRLVKENFSSPEALRQTLSILGHELLPAAGLSEQQPWLGRLAELTGELAAGYVDALRDRLFDEQELLKRAVFRARDLAEQARMTTEARFRAMFKSITVGIAICDMSGRIELVNPALSAILQRDEHALIGRHLVELIDEHDKPFAHSGLLGVANGDRARYVSDISFLDPDGEPIWTRLSISMVRVAPGAPTHLVGMVEDVTELHLLRHDQLTHSLRDQLTNLPNRTQFISTLDTVLRRADQRDHVALCYLDLDGFKIINDGVGHVIGDSVLIRVANTLLEAFPEESATVARVGGDGFAVLLTGTNGGFEVSQRIEDVLTELAEPVYADGETGVAVSASVGIVERPMAELIAAGLGSNELVRAAEVTVHRAKANGKAQWELYDAGQAEIDRARFKLGAGIAGGLENNEFAITYQPIAGLDKRELVGLHTTLHWDHPERGLLRPVDFIDMAEETGFIVHLGRWVVGEVGPQVAEWYRQFGERMPIVGLSLSSRMAKEQDLIQIFREMIERTGMPTHKIRVGVPSSVIVDRHGEHLDNLGFLRDIDVNAIVSGFGNGNFGLVDLTTLPVAGVSVSGMVTRAFAAAPKRSPYEQGLRQLVSLAKELDLPVLANGVDDEHTANRLLDVGIHYGGGAWLGGPMTPAETEEMIKSGHA